MGAGHGLADDSPLFHLCLRGGNNPEAIEESKSACRTYLARLMRGLPVGMVPKGQSFCIPHEVLLVLFRHLREAVLPQGLCASPVPF